MRYCLVIIFIIIACLSACDSTVINSPYNEQSDDTTLYTSFSLKPKHLDPARSYSSDEIVITGQVYEPPLQYHYLKRPYQLIPLTARQLPTVTYTDAEGNEVASDDDVVYSVYEIAIKEGIKFQPHPAFVQNERGEYQYHHLHEDDIAGINTLSDFEQQSSREVTAADYVYQIKRLAKPQVHSPILGLMTTHIVGLAEYAAKLKKLKASGNETDLRQHDISGVKVLDKYRYQITVFGKYPQLNYWLAMPFFAPIAWEAEQFYSQPSLIAKNITLDWFPVGTGPYYLTEHNPNQRIVLTKNPNYHADFYPTEGELDDAAKGLLIDRGKQLPFLDRVIFTLEKESISYWNKFLQGYYDISGISSDSFEQAVTVADSGEFGLSDAMVDKGITLRSSVESSIFYMGFNMLDPIVGGYSEQAKALRQAISIAIDQEEYTSIFANGRGIAAQGPLPPGIFGYREGEQGINPNVYDWSQNKAKRKSIAEARRLLSIADYSNGRSDTTGEPLLLYFDTTGSGPGAKARFDWMRKQFKKLNIQLVIRETDYNRFQDKIQTGQAQIFQFGWNADYPDPENFLFLLYGPNSKLTSGGQNSTNYQNSEYDRLFESMRVMSDTPERQQIIDKMVAILREDSPWVWGFHPKSLSLYHSWVTNVKPNLMANNTVKYRRIDKNLRKTLQQKWNQPILWPISVLFLMVILLLLPAWLTYQRKKQQKFSNT